MAVTFRNVDTNYRLCGVFSSAANFLADARNGGSAVEGDEYYDTTLNQKRCYNGSAWAPAGQTGTSAGSLDDAANVGTKITIDGAMTSGVEIEATNAIISANGQLLLLDNNDTGSDIHALEITSTSTASAIQITNTTATTDDIQGTADTWAITGQGNATFNQVNLLDDDLLRFGTSQDITMTWDQSKLVISGAAADSAIHIGDATNLDLVIFGDTTTDDITFDTSAEDVQFNGFDLTLEDDDILNFGDSDDVTLTWDQTDFLIDAAAADTKFLIGKTNNIDVVIYGDTSTDAVTFDTSAEDCQFNGFDLTLQDDDILNFGDGDDVTMKWDQTNWKIDSAAADTPLHLGDTSSGFDITYYFETSGTITTDYDGKILGVDGADIRLNDDDYLLFGDSAVGGSADGYIYWDQTNLKIGTGTGRVQMDSDVQIGTASSDEENLTVNGNLTVTGSFTHTGSYNPSAIAFDDDESLTFGTGSDVSLKWDQTNLLIEAVADDTGAIHLGATNSMDLVVYGSTNTKTMTFDVSTAILEINDWDINLQDDDVLQFGDAADITMAWDQTQLMVTGAAANNAIRIGDSTNLDLIICGGTTSNNITFDTDDAALTCTFDGFDLHMDDDDVLGFGDSQDVTITWDKTNLLIEAASDDTGNIHLGATNSMDLVIYGSTNTNTMTFDVSTAILEVNGWDINLQDDDILQFGDANDITMTWDQTQLVFSGAAANNAIHIGDATNLDLIIFGDTTTDAVTFDTDAEDVQFNGFDLTLQDDDVLNFGDADDITMTWDQSKLVFSGAAANNAIHIGDATNLDLVIFGGTTTNAITFDTDDAALHCTFNGFDLHLDDDDVLGFGDAQDITMTFDQTKLVISGAAADTAIEIGDATNLDLNIYGDNTAQSVKFDTSAETVTFTDFNITMSGTTSAVITCAYQSDFGGLTLPTHATSSPTGTPAGGSVFFEVDASKLWVHSSGGTWVGTVLS